MSQIPAPCLFQRLLQLTAAVNDQYQADQPREDFLRSQRQELYSIVLSDIHVVKTETSEWRNILLLVLADNADHVPTEQLDTTAMDQGIDQLSADVDRIEIIGSRAVWIAANSQLETYGANVEEIDRYVVMLKEGAKLAEVWEAMKFDRNTEHPNIVGPDGETHSFVDAARADLGIAGG